MSRPLHADMWKLLKELSSSAVIGMGWMVAFFAFLELPPVWAGAYGLALLALFTFVHIFRSDLRTRATVRLRSLAPGWILPVAGGGVELLTTISSAILRVNQDTILSSESNAIEAYANQPGGLLALVLLTVVVAPVIEEFVFRGWIQGALERQFGPLVAVPLAALAFACVHSEAWPILKFASGCFLGATVWATRSIWSSVLLHAASNLMAMALGAVSVVGKVDLEEFFRHDFFYVSVFLLMGSALALAVWVIGAVKSRKASVEIEA